MINSMRMVTAKNMIIAIRKFHVMDLSCSYQRMISNQNTHAFRPNFIVSLFKVQWCHHRENFFFQKIPLPVFHRVFSLRLQT